LGGGDFLGDLVVDILFVAGLDGEELLAVGVFETF
jgi:hypothetical protein